MQSVEQATSDSEEPTELGVVWERIVIRETEDHAAGPCTTGLDITSRNADTFVPRGSNAVSPTAVPKIVMEVESPCLSEYESDGFLSRRKKTLSKRSQVRLGIFKRAKTMTPRQETSDDDDDVVPFSRLMKVKEVNDSDGEEEDVPLVSLLHKANTNAIRCGCPPCCVCYKR